jgi:hypothetical protein
MSIAQKRDLAALLNLTETYNVKLSDSSEITLRAFLRAGDYRSALNLLKRALAGVLGPLKNLLTYTELQAEAAADAAQKNFRYAAGVRAFTAAANAAPSGGGGGGGGGGIPQQKQHGGMVRRGEPYIVGEAGPELFVPAASGQIIANPGMGNVSVGVRLDRRRFTNELDHDATYDGRWS